ncbi:hypothetical protein NQ317_001219 [Molorchus minor]|uniref:Uncharacterized protein n=1 Tax=Molorchus minor TaxID=1323400 RepID=A0ABQ9JSA6_9CUCU|nr:hypothetical protein NQ317_001219 [Molorchus minor]
MQKKAPWFLCHPCCVLYHKNILLLLLGVPYENYFLVPELSLPLRRGNQSTCSRLDITGSLPQFYHKFYIIGQPWCRWFGDSFDNVCTLSASLWSVVYCEIEVIGRKRLFAIFHFCRLRDGNRGFLTAPKFIVGPFRSFGYANLTCNARPNLATPISRLAGKN